MRPKCKVCFTVIDKPISGLQRTCGYKCALIDIEIAKQKKQEKLARKRLKEGREKLKSIADHLNDAQEWCNRYIRARDGNVCISCRTQKPVIQYAAGHYRTRGAAAHLRFNLDNIHVQCNKSCNKELSGNITAYRIALIKKIGIERVEAIENNNEIHRFTKEEALQIKARFKLMLKEINKREK